MEVEKQVTAGDEPLSPMSRLFSLPGHDCFNILIMGCKTEGDASVIVEGIKNTLINHPRFSSILDMGHDEHKLSKAKWIRTQVNVEEHVTVPEMDPNIKNPDQFLEEYISNMAIAPMDKSRPLWEFHLLQLKTSYAESVAVGRFHHALGDGMSLMSLLLACTRKVSDPKALPTVTVQSKPSTSIKACWFWSMVAWFWYIVKVVFHTCVEVFKSMVFVCFRGDNVTDHLMGKSGVTLSANKFIHRIISLEDVKFVKNAMNVTVNDVILGVVQAGLSRYLTQRLDLETPSKSRTSLKRLSLHGAVFFNLRPNRNIEDLANMMAKGSKVRWGNSIGFVVLPLYMKSENDILEYVRRAKATMDRKKLSLEPLFSYAFLKVIMEVFGIKTVNSFINKVFGRSTMIFSNVIGPTEEISFFGHQISYIAGVAIGIPQALTIDIQSYVDKVIFNFGVDEAVISDPHHLCDLIVEALYTMKTIAEEKICRDLYV